VPAVTTRGRASRPAQAETRRHDRRTVPRAHAPRLSAPAVRREAVPAASTRARNSGRAQAETRRPAAGGDRYERHGRMPDRRARN
jgi:hypothetical protein